MMYSNYDEDLTFEERLAKAEESLKDYESERKAEYIEQESKKLCLSKEKVKHLKVEPKLPKKSRAGRRKSLYLDFKNPVLVTFNGIASGHEPITDSCFVELLVSTGIRAHEEVFNSEEEKKSLLYDSSGYSALVDRELYSRVISLTFDNGSLLSDQIPRRWLCSSSGSADKRILDGATESGGSFDGESKLIHVLWNLKYPDNLKLGNVKMGLKSYAIIDYLKYGVKLIDLRLSNFK